MKPPRCLVAAAVLLLVPLGATAEPLDLASIYPSWQAWADEVAVLEGRIALFAALERERFDDAASLRRAVEVRDDVYRHAQQVEGFVRLRLQLDAADAEARSRQQRLDEVDRAWDAASRWWQPALVATGGETIARWSAPGAPLADHRHFFARSLRWARLGGDEAADAAGMETAGRLARQIGRAHDLLATAEMPAPEVALADGTTVTLTPATARSILWETPDPGDRRRLRQAWLESLGRFAGTYAALLEGVVIYRRASAEAQGFADPLAAALFADAVPAATVRSAVAAARRASAPLRRYHALRKRLLGIERYGTADRFVPLAATSPRFTFEQARALIVESAATLGPQVQDTVRRAFDDGWIDAAERPGKRLHGGATSVIGDHPWVLVSYRGNLDSLFQLAHEVGHACHAALAARAQPAVYAHPSSLTGEAVAALHEAVLVDLLIRRAATPEARLAVADHAVQNLLRLFVRPALDADFELSLYADGGGVTREALGVRYRATLERYYGDALVLDDLDAFGWMTTPHFFSSPLYLGRYPLAYAAATALADRLTAGDPGTRSAARRDLLTLLEAGSSDDPAVLLAAAGADLSDPGSAAGVAGRLDRLVDRLESLSVSSEPLAPSARPLPSSP